MIIDFHVHIFPPRVKADRSPYLLRDPGFRSLYDSPKARIATVDDLLSSMDRAGIDVSVLQGFGWASSELCREMNDYLMEAAARHPDRLVPLCTVQPADGEAALAELRRCTDAATPSRGLGEMRPEEQGYGLTDWTVLGALAAWETERRLPIVFHASEPVGHAYAGKGHMTPEVLYSLAQAFPDWPMVFAHLGGGLPFYTAMPEVRTALRNCYVDTAVWPLLYQASVFPPLVALWGADRILFGSDYPVLEQERVLRETSALPLDAAVLQAILGDNAARLLGLGS